MKNLWMRWVKENSKSRHTDSYLHIHICEMKSRLILNSCAIPDVEVRIVLSRVVQNKTSTGSTFATRDEDEPDRRKYMTFI
jgi:hypothetical protein